MDDLNTLADPARANRYQYAGSNPCNYVDPSGRSFDWAGLGDTVTFGVGCVAAVSTFYASGYGDLALAFGGFFGAVVATVGVCAIGGAVSLSGANYP